MNDDIPLTAPMIEVYDSEVQTFEEKEVDGIDDGVESAEGLGHGQLPVIDPEKQSNALNEIHVEFLKHLPRLQDDGTFNQPNANKGKMTQADVDKWLAMYPMGHDGNICRSAEIRAKACKPVEGNWDDTSMIRARNCFLVGDVIWQPYMFELYEKDSLMLHDRYRLNDGGVLLCCPYCNTNKFVSQKRMGFSTSDSKKISTYHGLVGHIVRFGKIYVCSNPECNVEEKEKKKMKKKTLSKRVRTTADNDDVIETTQFSSWTNAVVDSLPIDLQEKYGGGGYTTKGTYIQNHVAYIDFLFTPLFLH